MGPLRRESRDAPEDTEALDAAITCCVWQRVSHHTWARSQAGPRGRQVAPGWGSGGGGGRGGGIDGRGGEGGGGETAKEERKEETEVMVVGTGGKEGRREVK